MGKLKGLKKISDEVVKAKKTILSPKSQARNKTSTKLIESPKVKLAKRTVKVAGGASAGAAAATAYEGKGARIKRNKPKGVGKALRGFGKELNNG